MKPQLPHIKGFRPGRGPHGLIVPQGAGRQVKVALGYPFGGSVTWIFHESMTRLQRYELSKERPLLHHLLPQSGLYIDHNRNNITERFMTTGADWLLQIDSDIEFPATIVETMLEAAGSDKKILAASVPLGPPLPSCAWRMTEQPGIWKSVKTQHWCMAKHDGDKVCFGDLSLRSGVWTCASCGQSYRWDDEEITGQDVLTEAPMACDGLATAVILVHREVFQAIAEREGQCWFFKTLQPRLTEEASFKAWTREGRLVRPGEVGDGPVADRRFVSVGEDLAFCMRARDAGYQPWCFKMPGLRHHKTLPMSHDLEGAEAPASQPSASVATPLESPAPTPNAESVPSRVAHGDLTPERQEVSL